MERNKTHGKCLLNMIWILLCGYKFCGLKSIIETVVSHKKITETSSATL